MVGRVNEKRRVKVLRANNSFVNWIMEESSIVEQIFWREAVQYYLVSISYKVMK